MALKEFLAVIKDRDVARSNAFVVEIWPPKESGLAPDQSINLMVQDVSFPGQNIRTTTDDLRQGPTREIAQAVTYGSMNMTFICTPGLVEKLFFEAWQKLMFNHITWQAKYYKNYIGTIKLRALDRTTVVRYGIILHEAYPKIIMGQDYSNTNQDAIQTLQVEFNFHHWTRDDEVYGETPLWGSEGGEAEDIPRRKSNPDLTKLTLAQSQAIYRGETIKVLNGEGVAVDVSLEGIMNKAPLGLGSAMKTMLAPAAVYATVISPGVGNKKGSDGVIPAPVHPRTTTGKETIEAEDEGLTLMSCFPRNKKVKKTKETVTIKAAALKYQGAVQTKGAPDDKPSTSVGGLEQERTYSVNSRTGETNPWPDPLPDPNGPQTPAQAYSALLGILGPLKAGPSVLLGITDGGRTPQGGGAGWNNPNTTPKMKSFISYTGAVQTDLQGVVKQAEAAGHDDGGEDAVIPANVSANGLLGGLISNMGIASAAGKLRSGISVSKFSFTASLAGKGISLRTVGTTLGSKGSSAHWSGGGGAKRDVEGGESGDEAGDR